MTWLHLIEPEAIFQFGLLELLSGQGQGPVNHRRQLWDQGKINIDVFKATMKIVGLSNPGVALHPGIGVKQSGVDIAVVFQGVTEDVLISGQLGWSAGRSGAGSIR